MNNSQNEGSVPQNQKDVHIQKLRYLTQRVLGFYQSQSPVRIFHGGTNTTRPRSNPLIDIVDLSQFNKVLELNEEGGWICVEPNVSMNDLLSETLHHNLMPPVVMEFPNITVGGGVQGGAGESSSFKQGLFHKTCESYEVVLGDGSIVIASRKENPDLFYGTPCSCGSLGILTSITLQLVPAKEYVHLKYERAFSFDDVSLKLLQASKGDSDFVDGIIFNKECGVVMTGSLSDRKNLPLCTFSKTSDEWFYLHAQRITKDNTTYEEIIPLKDYLFRYDRAAFWGGKYVFKRFHLPSWKILRSFLNPMLTTKRLYRVWQATNISQQYIVQDIAVPSESLRYFLRLLDSKMNIYPLWLCPLKPDETSKLAPNYIQTDMVVNVGIWGEGSKNFEKFLSSNRELERLTKKLGGRKVLYAHTYYPEEEFWDIYDHTWYNQLRCKYKAKVTFPNIYNKVHVTEQYKVRVFSGLVNLILEKVLTKNKKSS